MHQNAALKKSSNACEYCARSIWFHRRPIVDVGLCSSLTFSLGGEIINSLPAWLQRHLIICQQIWHNRRVHYPGLFCVRVDNCASSATPFLEPSSMVLDQGVFSGPHSRWHRGRGAMFKFLESWVRSSVGSLLPQPAYSYCQLPGHRPWHLAASILYLPKRVGLVPKRLVTTSAHSAGVGHVANFPAGSYSAPPPRWSSRWWCI